MQDQPVRKMEPVHPETTLQEREPNQQLAMLQADLSAKNIRINELETRLAAAEASAELQQKELDTIRRSASWRIVHQLWLLQMRLFPYGTRRREVYRTTVTLLGRLLFRGIGAPLTQEGAYRLWRRRNEPSPAQLKKMAQTAKKLAYRPVISIVVPVYKTPEKVLREAIESVRNQIYGQWELCLADDGSECPELASLLKEYAEKDARIRFVQLPQGGGISSATNAATSLARGEFIAFLDHDDTLSPEALYRVVEVLQKHPDADLIYSDEDKLGATGERYDPFFKPDWSPDLLLSMNYVCHFLIVRRELFEAVGRLRSDFDGSQDYDLILRVTERTSRIHHIPRVLYHWRSSEGSTAQSPDAKPTAHIAARRAIGDYLDRNKIRATVEPGVAVGRWRVRYEITNMPKVTLIIPAGPRVELLRKCLGSILASTDYGNFDVMIVDNSKGTDVQQLLTSFPRQRAQVAYVDYRNHHFSFSALNNFAVRQAAAPLVLFLNDDTEAIRSDWLTALVEHGQRPAVGVVGGKLLYPSGLIQHAGVTMGIHENAGHAFKHLHADSPSYFDFAQVVRNCSAVTAACMLTKRDLFLELGGFNEIELAVSFQDPDYCLRVCQAGFLVVYTPYSVVMHHESASRGVAVSSAEVRYMQKRWAGVIAHDPYYSPNLTRATEDYSLRLD
jgi:GT2 family glycosyltransferase